MKNIILYTVCFIFAANTLVVNAAFKPCMQNNNPVQIELLNDADMPCHETEESLHCEDICFCLAYSVNQTPYFDLSFSALQLVHEPRFTSELRQLHSINQAPLYRPPILIS